MFWPWLIFIDFLLITCLSSASSLLFGRALLLLYRLSIDNHLRMAPSFIAFMGEMTILSVALAVNGFVMLVNWHRDGYNSAELVFWSGVLGGCLIPAVPIGVLFLSIDRLIIITRPHFYGQCVKRTLGLFSVFSVLILTLLHFYFNLSNELFQKEKNECWTFACFSSEFSISIYAIDRFLVAVPNFIASIALLLLLIKQQGQQIGSQSQIAVMSKSQTNQQQPAVRIHRRRLRTADRIALNTAILLFTFDLVPSTANLIATYVYDTNLSTVIGPYRQITGAMNALGCALIYWRYFERKWAQRKQIAPVVTSGLGGRHI